MNSLLSVTTPAEFTALTTVERVKLELSISGPDSDALLAAKIDEASSDIAVRVDPSLRRETLTETFWPEGREGRSSGRYLWQHGIHAIPSLRLKRYPVASVASVTLDGVLIDPSEYRLDDASLLYRLSSSGHPWHWSFGKTAIIVYDAGYLLPGEEGRDLPASLEAAAVDLVASYWNSRGRDPLVKSDETAGIGRFEYWVGAVGEIGDLPPGVMAKIAPFMSFGGFA